MAPAVADEAWVYQNGNGNVTGRVTTQDTSVGLANASVEIVNIVNNSVLASGRTDADGYYRFAGVPVTWDGSRYAESYMVHASKAPLGEAYSSPLGVEANSTAVADVKIYANPTSTPMGIPDVGHWPMRAGMATPTPRPASMPDMMVYVEGAGLDVTGYLITAPSGFNMTDLARNGTIVVQLEDPGRKQDNRLLISVVNLTNSTGIIAGVRLVSNATALQNGRNISVSAAADLYGLPADGRLNVAIRSPEEADMGVINDTLKPGGLSAVGKPLAVVEVGKTGLENGRDIKAGSLTLTLQRPAGWAGSANYKVIRWSEGSASVLEAKLASGPEADPLVFEIASPEGFSIFALVETTSPHSSEIAVTTQPAAGNGDSTPSLSDLAGLLVLVVMALAIGLVVLYLLFGKKS